MSVSRRSPFSIYCWTLTLLTFGAILTGGQAALGQSPAAFTWVRTIVPAGPNPNGSVADNAFDSAGNALVAGMVSTNPGGNQVTVFTVAKYDPAGNQVWLRQIAGTNARARVVAVDGQDAVIAGGFADQPLLVKWAANGTPAWTISPPFNPSAIAVDNAGDIILGGGLANNDWAVAKFRAGNGSLAWMRQGNGGVAGSNNILSIAVDGANHVAAAGYGQTGGGPFGFLVMRLNGSTGNPFWPPIYDGDPNQFDTASCVDTDAAGNVIASGHFTENGIRLFTVVKYDAATGARKWINQTVGGASSYGWATGVAVNTAGNPVAAGFIEPKPDEVEIHAAAAFNGATGTAIWSDLTPETAVGGFAFADAAALDNQNNLASSGASGNYNPYFLDFTVWQHSSAGELKHKRVHPSNGGGEAITVAVDSKGNISAGGYSAVQAGGSVQFTVAYVAVATQPAVDLAFGQQPTDALAGSVIVPPVSVRLVDSAGATVPGANTSVTLGIASNPGGATLGGTLTVAAVNGIATFNNLTVSKPGIGYTLKATAATLPGKSAFSQPFTISPNSVAGLSLTAPLIAVVGTTFDVTVRALNSTNAVAADYRGRVTFSSSNAAVITPVAYTFTAADAGVHVFKIKLTALGTQTISVSDPTLPTPNATASIIGVDAASLVVTTESDIVSQFDGVTSLREAITHANAKAGKDTVTFKIPGAGLHTLRPTTPLPALTDAVVIDGFTQPGATPNTKSLSDGIDAVLLIEISGQNVPVGNTGLKLTASGCLVRGLVINRFREKVVGATSTGGAAIEIETGGATVSGCFLGSDARGLTPLANGFGVRILGGSGVIGGNAPAARNLLSGNINSGVLINGPTSDSNVVSGNYIGVDVTGRGALPNLVGVATSSSKNTIGGSSASAGNVIAGNSTGIFLSTPGGENTVKGNLIGTDATGSAGLGTGFGMYVGSNGNLIGGSNVSDRNVISGNATTGVHLFGERNAIRGNLIGLNAAGDTALGNKVGILVFGRQNVIGGSGSAGNVVSANTVTGVEVQGFGTVIQGNQIGTNQAGTVGLSPGTGLRISGSQTQVGGSQKSLGNLVSGNTVGVNLTGNSNSVEGNRIGTDQAGVAPIPNGFGIAISGNDNTIGGLVPAAGNHIAFSNIASVRVENAAARNGILGNSIHGPSVGLDLGADGLTPNDPYDTDNGPNHLQNHPLLSDVVLRNGKVKLSGSLRSRSGFSYRLEFFASPALPPYGYSQGQTFLGSQTVKIGGAKNAVQFTFTAPVPAKGANLYYTATASLIDGALFETSELCPALRGSFAAVKINFQPKAAPVPPGHIIDDGSKFGTHNGFRYGWNDDATADTVDRNSAASPDQRYDTLIHMQKGKKVDWEIEVPNGKYTVHLVGGDPNLFDSDYSIDIEDKKFLRGTPVGAPKWFEETDTVTVKDGRLTISNGKGAVNNKLCFVEITPL